MGSQYCVKCNKYHREDYIFCPICGEKMEDYKTPVSHYVKGIENAFYDLFGNIKMTPKENKRAMIGLLSCISAVIHVQGENYKQIISQIYPTMLPKINVSYFLNGLSNTAIRSDKYKKDGKEITRYNLNCENIMALVTRLESFLIEKKLFCMEGSLTSMIRRLFEIKQFASNLYSQNDSIAPDTYFDDIDWDGYEDSDAALSKENFPALWPDGENQDIDNLQMPEGYGQEAEYMAMQGYIEEFLNNGDSLGYDSSKKGKNRQTEINTIADDMFQCGSSKNLVSEKIETKTAEAFLKNESRNEAPLRYSPSYEHQKIQDTSQRRKATRELAPGECDIRMLIELKDGRAVWTNSEHRDRLRKMGLL